MHIHPPLSMYVLVHFCNMYMYTLTCVCLSPYIYIYLCIQKYFINLWAGGVHVHPVAAGIYSLFWYLDRLGDPTKEH